MSDAIRGVCTALDRYFDLVVPPMESTTLGFLFGLEAR